MGKKKKHIIILILIVIVLCAAGICYYFLDFSRNFADDKKKKQIITGTVYAEYKNNDFPKDKIKKIKNADVILADLKNDNILVGVDNAVKNYNLKTGKRKAVKYIETSNTIEEVCSDGKVIAWIQEEVLSDGKPSYQSIYYCKIGDEKNVLVDRSRVEVDKDHNAVIAQYSLLSYLKIYDNKIIYAAVDAKKLSVEYKSFDINTAQKKDLFVDSISNKEDKYTASFPINFEIDLKHGYIIADIINASIQGDSATYSLALLDMNKKSKKVLANSKDEFSTSIQYPNLAFSVDKDIHVYNIEKNKDDFTIKCNGHAKNVDIKDRYVSWNENKIYAFSMDENKTYTIDNGWFQGSRENEGQKKLVGDMIYWSDYGKLSYVKMADK